MEELCPLSKEEELAQLSLKSTVIASVQQEMRPEGLRGPAADFLIEETFCCWSRSLKCFHLKSQNPKEYPSLEHTQIIEKSSSWSEFIQDVCNDKILMQVFPET